jgi:hypothetical protein
MENTRAPPCGLQWRKLVELFRKHDSRFYCYDFKVRGKRYRGSTKETNKKRAGRIGALRLSQALGGTGLLDRKAPSLLEFSTQFLGWVKTIALASKTKKYYANGWRLLSRTRLVSMRLDHITKDDIDILTFHVPAPSVNCALRTLRRMLHKAEEWNLLIKVPRFKLLPEHGRKLRLDEEAEQKLLPAANSLDWKTAVFDLLRDHPCSRHRNAKRERAVPHSRRKSRLEQPSHLCTRQ